VLLLSALLLALARGADPCVIAWDADSGEFRRVEGPAGFTTWEDADEAAMFLVPRNGLRSGP